jgi:1-acyl-sn-glycerol-3-phosphate acyltransferase
MPADEVGKLYPVAKAVLTPLFRAGWRFQLEGLENVPAHGGAILCPNHTSVLDSFFVPALLPRRVSYVGKAEYMDSWKTRYIFPALGMIPIDREGGDAGERALATAQKILESGQLFGIYPEGTRSRDGRLYRGHTGPARLALRTGSPIIPIGIVGAREVMPPDAKFPTLRLPVTIRFGKPIDVDRYQGRANDRMVLRQLIDEVMYEIRELSGQEYVDEYANKKKAAAPAPVPEPAVANGSAAATSNGNGSAPSAPAAAPEPAPGAVNVDDSAFVESTKARSSADALKAPIRRSPV